MKARDVFGLIVRIVAGLILFYGLWYLLYAIALACGLPERNPEEMAMFFVAGMPTTLGGLLLLRFAHSVVRFTYRDNKDDSDSDPNH